MSELNKYDYAVGVFRLESSTQYGFQVGRKTDEEYIDEEDMEIICTKGSYKNKQEAFIAGWAFVEGIKFARGESDD